MDPKLQALLDSLEKLTEGLDSSTKALTDEEKAALKARQKLEDLVKAVDRSTTSFKQNNTFTSQVIRNLSATAKNLDSVREQLEDLDEAIENTIDSEEKAELQARRNALLSAAATADNIEALKAFGVSVKKIGATGIQGAGAFVKGLQSGQSGIELSTGLMTSALDMAGEASAGAGQLAGTMGQVMLNSTNPKLKALGAVASVVGPALGMLGESANKLAKFGVEVLSKEVEKTVKAFNTASASGALFADGMTGLRTAANNAGLTTDQFAAVLEKNSANLAAAGLGVSEGAKRVGGALRAGGDSMKQQLLNLGYSFEEQAGLVAETMKDMRGSGGPLRASNAEVAAQTAKYAENLRVISAITGEDAKKKMDQVREQANQLAFQQKLAGMDEAQRKGVINAMANMSDIERKNFMDMVNFGAVVNTEGAAAAALSQGLNSSVQASYKAFQEGKLDELEQRKIAGQYGDQVKKDMLQNTAIGLAGAAGVGGLAQALSESMGKELQFRNSFTPEAIAAAEKQAAAQKTTTDSLTASVTGAETAAQNLKLSLEKELTPAIAKFAEVSKQMLGEVQKMLKDLGIGKGPDADKGQKNWFNKATDWLSAPGHVSGILKTAGIGTAVAGLAADTTGIGAVAGVPLNVIGGVLTGAGYLAELAGFARGGVSSGPDDGYITKLHGTEAVVPLPDGKTIPVSINTPESGMGNMDVAGILKDIANPMAGLTDLVKQLAPLASKDVGNFLLSNNTNTQSQQSNEDWQNRQYSLMQEMIGHLRDHKDIAQKLLLVSQ